MFFTKYISDLVTCHSAEHFHIFTSLQDVASYVCTILVLCVVLSETCVVTSVQLCSYQYIPVFPSFQYL